MRADAILGLVQRLLTYEAAASQDQEALIEAAERISDNLRVHLSKRIGQEGFRTILARALSLTTANFPSLNAVRVGTDGSLVGLRAAMSRVQGTQNDEAEIDNIEGAVALIAQLLALLISFIGEDLTLRLLGAVWPEISWDDVTGPENERP